MLVTLEEAKEHAALDNTFSDSLILKKIASAEKIASALLNRKIFYDQNALDEAIKNNTAGSSAIVMDELIHAAILLLFADLIDQPANIVAGVSVNEIPFSARQILNLYRSSPGI